ncbi:amino acid/amide ABC transporter membrane protein 2 (HAAT family) /amino acid/amide ABC transporter ATP-binding protein 1 (HAAT family) [Actinocorallia herbida]|uniref:Amino acid/amide ABC transporter membrane protein 2 (HAAT family) /amino acid/amide ABC transporter ATP-binding protein 1 (HAAT family) n=1 Tax=Actinocorallia herbida TaxID=58109 RepID=A0A3N1CVA3_9ACTN|nr:branched-chain amino acid ABC transporter ATP-binding protein/permease [Actinocorallia herbida]ROO85240.1 amino acid/amide ABC transporter membrane protein 2 (HAAT family) /amino acid/amide ABC transporter ATP-binding protein 1 (HAAT family) [Actinocorallia herbida]
MPRPVRLGLAALSAVLGAVLLAWPFITDFYSYNASYYNGVVAAAAISGILTISLNLAMGYGGMMSMLHTGLQLVGGYAAASLTVKAGLPWPVGIALAVPVGAGLAAAVLLVSLRATSLYFGMITLAANLIVIEAGRAWEDVTGGVNGVVGVAPGSLSKVAFYYVVLVFLGLAYLVQRNLMRSGVGRASLAVMESPDTASAMGVRPATTRLLVFTVAGGIAGVSGALYALQLGFINPDVGLLDNGLTFFVGLFVGGIGTLVGPVLGVGVVALLVELIKDYGRYTTLILGVALLMTMIVLPRGIVGTFRASRFGRVDDGEVSGEAEPEASLPDGILPEPPETDHPALEGRGLVKHFGGVKAVDGVDVAVRAGTVHGIIGPNGSGKSTTVSCLTRFHALDAGEVLVFGEPSPAKAWQVPALGVTRVFQVPHLFEQQTVLDNVLTGMRRREGYGWLAAVLRLPSYRRRERAGREAAARLLAFAGLSGRAHRLAGSLSHGQKRLLEVVRAVASGPRVLILDEPATGLTPAEIDALGRLCRTFRDRGLAVVLIEHNVEFVMGLCDEITVIDGGKVIAAGPPETVRRDPKVLEAYLGRPDLIEEVA